jgi:hypothetical protein
MKLASRANKIGKVGSPAYPDYAGEICPADLLRATNIPE